MPVSIHVAVDAHNLARDDRGIGRYARAVLSRAVRDAGFRWTFVLRSPFPRRTPISRALGGAAVTVAGRVPRDADVVWFPWNGTFLRSAAPSVATVHDCAPFAYPADDARRRATEQGPFLRTAATARRILVQSRSTASEVEHWLGVDAARIVVTPLAADPVFVPGAPEALPAGVSGRRYVLCVGAHDPRKNTRTLGAAFARAFPGGDVGLVFTRRPVELPPGGIVVDASSDRALVALYRGAALVVVPSLSEGFGLTLLEALACGAPVLAARTGALPEVGADAAAWIDDPLATDVWARRMRALLDDPAERARLVAAGPPRAATFSWERCTAQTLAVLRDVAESNA